MPTIDLRANRSSVFAHGTYDTGGGADDHMPIATDYSGLDMRAAFDFPAIDWAGVTEVTAATLELTSTSQVHVARGSSPSALLKRCTAQWKPNGSSDDGGGNWTTDPDHYPGPSTTSSGERNIVGRDGNELTDSWDVLGLILAWAPTSVKGPGGATGAGAKQYGLALRERSGSQYRAEWYSAKAGTTSKRPRLIITTKTGSAPGKPALVAPLGPDADARTLRFTFGAAITSWDVDVSTDPAFGSTVWAPRAQTGGITGGTAVAAPYAGAPLGTVSYYWRARGTNAIGVGAWSGTGSFTPDPSPGARDPWEEWAEAILSSQADPRLVLRPGTVRPHDEEVAELVTADMAARVVIDLTDTSVPMVADCILAGMRVEVDHGGWTVDAVLGVDGAPRPAR